MPGATDAVQWTQQPLSTLHFLSTWGFPFNVCCFLGLKMWRQTLKNGSLSLCLERIIQRCWIMMGLQYRFSFITLGSFAAGCRRFDWGKNHDLIRNGRTSLSFSNTVDCRETDAKICRQRLRLTLDQRPKSPTYKLLSELPMIFVLTPCLRHQGLSVSY